MQDNARPHTVRLTLDTLPYAETKLVLWAASIPDLYHLEHLRHYFQSTSVDNGLPLNSQQDLINVLKSCCDSISQDNVKHLVESIICRIESVFLKHTNN